MLGWPTSLLLPRDIRGQLCGEGYRMDTPYYYFLAPTVDLNVGICVKECPSSTGKPICIYEGTSSLPTTFCYTQIACDSIGRFCYPQEPEPRAKVDTYLSGPENVMRRIISDVYAVKVHLTPRTTT